MLACSLPISALASGITDVVNELTSPYATVAPEYFYEESNPDEYRALPNMQGVFNLTISLNKAPTNNKDVVVYYRTIDDSAVAKWGDYDSVGTREEAFVILNKETILS